MSESFPVGGVIDAHMHLMPDRLMTAIRESLSDTAGWSFDHPTDLDSMTEVLERAGVEQCIALPYAHRPGIAPDLNEWICEETADSEMAIPFATVHAADEDVGAIVEEAFSRGARGLKFQLPVQGFAADDPRLDPAYEVAAEWDYPVLFHAGTAPMFRGNPPSASNPSGRSSTRTRISGPVAHTWAPTNTRRSWIWSATARTFFLDTTFAMSSVADTYMDFNPSVIGDAAL